MKKVFHPFLSLLTASLVIGTLSPTPALSARPRISSVVPASPASTIPPKDQLPPKDKQCNLEINKIELGSFIVTIPAGEVEQSTEKFKESTVTTIGTTVRDDTEHAGLVVYFDDYRPVMEAQDPVKGREAALNSNIAVWQKMGLQAGKPYLEDLNGLYSFRVDFHNADSSMTVRVYFKLLENSHEMVNMTVFSRAPLSDCTKDRFDVRLKN